MTNNQQNVVSLAIIIIVVVIVGCLGEKPPPEPAGLLSLNSTSMGNPYAVGEVKLYSQLPVGGKVVGELTAELAFDLKKNEQAQVEKLETYARTRAGAAGANAIVVEMFAQRGHVLYFAGKLVTVYLNQGKSKWK